MDNFKNDIERYIKGELTPAEMHRLEKMALSDPFLADALEGAESAGAENFYIDLKDAENRLEEKQNTRKPWFTSLRIAASFGLLLVGSYFVYTSYLRPKEIITHIAKVDSITNPTSANSKIKDSVSISAIEDPKQNLLSFDHSAPKDDQEMASKVPASSPASVMSKPEIPIAELSESKISEPASQDSAKVEEELINLTKNKKQLTAADAQHSDKKTFSEPQSTGQSSAARADVISKESDRALPLRDITGKVVSAEDGSAMPGVNVILKGSSIGTVTDVNGRYTIRSSDAKGILVFSFIGCISKETPIGLAGVNNIELNADVSSLSEVVVTGYGVDRKKNIAGVKDDPSTIFAKPMNGERDFNNYLKRNLQYPTAAIEKKIQGKVWVEFTVKKDSSLSDFRVLHGIGYGCEEELIRLIKAGPAWVPLQQSETSFDSKVQVRFKFSLPK